MVHPNGKKKIQAQKVPEIRLNSGLMFLYPAT